MLLSRHNGTLSTFGIKKLEWHCITFQVLQERPDHQVSFSEQFGDLIFVYNQFNGMVQMFPPYGSRISRVSLLFILHSTYKRMKHLYDTRGVQVFFFFVLSLSKQQVQHWSP